MTVGEIEKKINEELDLWEIVDCEYNEITKELFLDIVIDFSKEFVENEKFKKKLTEVVHCGTNSILEELDNESKLLFRVIFENNTIKCLNKIETKIEQTIYQITKTFFQRLFIDWNLI